MDLLELSLMEGVPWKVKQVSTHCHLPIQTDFLTRILTPGKIEFSRRGLMHRDCIKIESGGRHEFPIIDGPGCIVNIWFTFIAPSHEEIENNLRRIAEETGIEEILNLPATRVFKIKAHFKL